MGTLARTITAYSYRHVIKPLLFLRHPDAVHTDIVSAGKVVQSAPGVRRLPEMWQYQNKPMLRQVIAGVEFPNPIGLAAGFDKNIELAPLLKSVGFGFMTGGSVTARPCSGNKKPWFHRLPADKSLVVHAGLPNKGVDTAIQTIARYDRRVFDSFPLIVSVAKTNDEQSADEEAAIDDYCHSLERLEASDSAALYEVNISCPNTFGGEPFTTPKRLDNLLTRIDTLQLSKLVVIKMPIGLDWDRTSALLDVIVKHRVIGVTIGNLLKDRTRASLTQHVSDQVLGGLSGVPTRDISTELIRKTYKKYGNTLIIIGVGGVFSAEDAYEKIRAGASLVELITGMIFEGPQLIGEINYGIEQLLRRDGYRSITAAIGSWAK